MGIVCIGDISISNWKSMFLHCSNVGKRNRCGHTIKTWETDVPIGVLNNVAIQVRQWSIRADLRRNILMAEEAHIPCIASWLIWQHIRLTGIGTGAEWIIQGTVNADTYKVSLWQR